MRKTVRIVALFLVFGIMALPRLVGAQPASPASVYLDGSPLSFEHEVVEVNGYNYVPFRNLFEALNVTIDWNPSTKTIIGQSNSDTLELQIGSLTALVNGKSVILDAAPFIRNGASYVPLRFASQSLGLLVQWYSAEKVIRLSTNYVTLNIKNVLGDKVTNEEVSVRLLAKEPQQEPYSLDHRQATMEMTGLLPEREYEVSVQVKDSLRFIQPKPFTFVYKAGMQVLPDLMLEDAPSDLLRGTVTDEDGNPVPNLTLMVLDENAGEETLNKVNTLVYPDEKGRYSLPNLIAGHRYNISVQKLSNYRAGEPYPDHAYPWVPPFTYKPGMKSLPSIVVPKAQWVGNIALSDGIISAIVFLNDEDGTQISHSPYYGGKYVLGGMVKGQKYRISYMLIRLSSAAPLDQSPLWSAYWFTYDPAAPAPDLPITPNK
ncbi:hypothetical protein D3H35_07550 [Cohnella faecalis]|uniref:Copper amine oxidase-like N-terminal domain-containing protein n=1 Tax=Cohnella faecalis TaxID=2315694 RepID=A0A398CQI9_9BACL|nr:hypothetical protein D3H35_07550 [Cohnella faecalis]